jgi:hypothetical protein
MADDGIEDLAIGGQEDLSWETGDGPTPDDSSILVGIQANGNTGLCNLRGERWVHEGRGVEFLARDAPCGMDVDEQDLSSGLSLADGSIEIGSPGDGSISPGARRDAYKQRQGRPS